MGKRKEKRFIKNMLVYLKNDSFEYLGMTANLSKTGMFVESRKIMPLKSELDIILASDKKELFNIKAEVMWSKSDDNRSSGPIPMGMGLKIFEAPAEYWNFMEYIKYG